MNGLENREMLTGQDFEPTHHYTVDWPGSKNQQNKTDNFSSIYSAIYNIVNSRKDKDRALEEQIVKRIVRRGVNEKIEAVQKKHQRAITGHGSQVQTIQYAKLVLETQQDFY